MAQPTTTPTAPTAPTAPGGPPEEAGPITIAIPAGIASRVLDAVAATQGYDPGGELTRPQFLRKVILSLLKGIVAEHEIGIAAGRAAEEAREKVEAEILLE